jgi:sulfofructose kinase
VVDSFPGEENVEEAQGAVIMGGGPVATALVAAASLGSRTTMLDQLGASCWRSQHILREFEVAGVCTRKVELAPDAEASLATVFVRRSDGARAIRFVRSTANALDPEAIDPEHLLGHRFVHCNGRHPAACLAAAALCRSSDGKTKLSFDGGAGRYRPEILPILAEADIAIVAHDFAVQATGATEPEAAASGLAKLCPNAELIGITSGTAGSWLFPHAAASFHQPAFPVANVVDTTGCGDVYHGAFLHALCEDANYREAAKLASAAGALNATALGGRGALPTSEAIDQLITS